MSNAAAYGLMGAAQGLLAGLYGEWDQNQKDIRDDKLARAKMQEKIGLEQLKHQYASEENVQKVLLQFEADSALHKQDSDAEDARQQAKLDADSDEKQKDRDAELSRAQISAGATLGAAHIRADADEKPKPRGEQIWQLPDGRNVLVKPDEAPPDKGQLIWTNGGSVGARQRGGTPGIGSTLNGAKGVPAVTSAAASPAPAAAPAPAPAPSGPGSSANNPIDATSTSAPPPAGTWVRLPSGRVMQMPGA